MHISNLIYPDSRVQFVFVCCPSFRAFFPTLFTNTAYSALKCLACLAIRRAFLSSSPTIIVSFIIWGLPALWSQLANCADILSMTLPPISQLIWIRVRCCFLNMLGNGKWRLMRVRFSFAIVGHCFSEPELCFIKFDGWNYLAI